MLRLWWEDKWIWISNSNWKMSKFKVFIIFFFNQTYKGCKKRFSYVDLQKCQIHDTWKTFTLLLCWDLVVVGVWTKTFGSSSQKLSFVVWCYSSTHSIIRMQPVMCCVHCCVLAGSSSFFGHLFFFKLAKLWNRFMYIVCNCAIF